MRIQCLHYLILFMATTLFGACDLVEIKENYYPDYASLYESNEPGNWVPVFIPESATEIYERHNLDTSGEVLKFSYEKETDMKLSGYCKAIPFEEIVFPEKNFLGVNWWPTSLSRDSANKNDHDFYSCDTRAYLALNKKGQPNQIYYWRILYY